MVACVEYDAHYNGCSYGLFMFDVTEENGRLMTIGATERHAKPETHTYIFKCSMDGGNHLNKYLVKVDVVIERHKVAQLGGPQPEFPREQSNHDQNPYCQDPNPPPIFLQEIKQFGAYSPQSAPVPEPVEVLAQGLARVAEGLTAFSTRPNSPNFINSKWIKKEGAYERV
ncbi:rhamnulose-1-phosphate aldolase/alcoholdehydrogenase [Striga asiatica]|uniref:Rhamnulose-1-phosphate aldolase/alcoholdehydrogenase n=1 Tax=Striga asiatica TaxID=4170 RepID=A0A5A7PK92_STRAF|nr:rhamnulose-1-phosphate aldolase/alcoholdehydrogenase [Striga asiatica]